MQSRTMAPLSAEEVRRIAGPLDDIAVARILANGATAAELIEAQQWLTADEDLATDRARPLTGRVRMLYELLEAEARPPEEDRAGAAAAGAPAA